MIFAIDFDGTIVKHEFPEIGEERPLAIKTLKQLQERGHKIIIWTCRNEKDCRPMLDWLKNRGFIPDAVNRNIDGNITFAWPKILADIYIDDRNFPEFPGWQSVRSRFL